MDYDEYAGLAGEARALHDAGKHVEALAIFDGLAETDISALDRASMLTNAGYVCEALGRFDEALAAYDKAVALQRPLQRSSAVELKAALLHRLGRDAEALALYRQLAAEPWAIEEEKLRYRHNIAALGG